MCTMRLTLRQTGLTQTSLKQTSLKQTRLPHAAPILLAVSLAVSIFPVRTPAAAEQHLLYVANPGTRNSVEYGGVGILVFDIDNGYKFVRRIPTWGVPAGEEPENVKRVAASARTGLIYVTSLNRVSAIDMISGKRVWDKTYEGGCDRLAISPDG